MKNKHYIGTGIAGAGAGAVNGLLGAGGGMVLIPLLTIFAKLNDDEVFPASVCIVLPMCAISFGLTFQNNLIPWSIAIPYLFGSVLGGILAGIWGKKIPTVWLHRILGIMILWGGVRYLC